MLKHAILLVFVLFITDQVAAKCSQSSLLIGQTCTFKNEKTDETITIDADRSECMKHDDKCCWQSGRCITIMTDAGKPEDTEKGKKVFKKPTKSARFLPGFKPPIPPICPKGKQTVPLDCKYSDPQPYVTEPPTDVPYCVRIPCSLDRKMQPVFDRDHFKCGSQPGCYYDVELADFRKAFGPGVLAGVPVCHLAIRNSVFFREAQKTISMTGSWNPYYTHCLLDRFSEEIEEERDGCKFLDVLFAFKINPKMAGWKGINRRQCNLIDGCWKNAQCFYPYEINQDVTVKSGQRFNIDKYEIRFGRPKCQEFDNRTPYSTLKSYHSCLMSGCSVDTSVSNNYYQYLYQLGLTMKFEDTWKFWERVEGGKIGPYNLDDAIQWDYIKSGPVGKPSSGPPPPPPGSSGPFSPPGSAGGPPPPSDPFAAPPSSGVFSPPGGSSGGFTPPRAGSTEACGPNFKAYGYLPCPPRKPPVMPKYKHCPYKPFHVPRFDPLKGSFKGCCDVNLCYLSRADIRKMHSGPSRYLTEWSYWSKCSKTCGKGLRTRTRMCVGNNQEKCGGQLLEQTEACELNKCGRWTEWSRWFPECDCSPFGWPRGGTERKRRCLPKGAVCDGEKEEAMMCSEFCKTVG